MTDPFHRMPAVNGAPDQRTPAVARHDAIHCCQSGLTDESLRISPPLAEPVCKAITQAAGTVPTLTSIEVLFLTGVGVPTLVIHGSRRTKHNTGWLAAGNSSPERSVGGDQLAALLQQQLPDWYGIEQGTLVLDTLGIAAVPTSRLVYSDEPPSVPALESLLRDVLTHNHARNVPTVGQVLIQSVSRDQFRVTTRAAEVGLGSRPLGRYGLASSIESSPVCPIDRATPERITSSRCVADDDWETDTTGAESDRVAGLVTSEKTDAASQAALTSLGLRNSTHEYAGLLQGRPADDPYNALPVEPTMTLSTTELQALLDVTPHYEPCHWPAKPTRHAPRFIRDRVRTQAAGTDHEELLAAPHRVMTQLGVQSGESFIDFVSGWLAETGIHADTVDDRSYGEPHLRGHPHDETGPVVAVAPDSDGSEAVVETAGELIMAANRARQTGSHLLVVTPSQKAAWWARDVLEVPYANRRAPDRHQLYSIPAYVYTNAGDIVVIKRDSPSPYWVVTDDGRRALYAEDQCLAAGPITAPLTSYSFETPRVTTHRDLLAIVGRDGRIRQTVPSLADCADEYQAVRRPIMPTHPLFCAKVTIAYRDGSSLVEPIRSRSLANNSTLLRKKRCERAVESFLKTYTISNHTSDDIGTGQFIEYFLAWYDEQTMCRRPPVKRVARTLSISLHPRIDTLEPSVLDDRSWWLPTIDLSLETAHGCSSATVAHEEVSDRS